MSEKVFLCDPSLCRFLLPRYMCSLSFFHYSEYLVTAIINPHSLSLDSFLLNHSVEYSLAAISSWLEFTVEKLTVPGRPSPQHSYPFMTRASLPEATSAQHIGSFDIMQIRLLKFGAF